MVEVDRVLALIKPTKALVAWLNDNGNESYNLEELTADSTSVLMPVFEDPEAIYGYLEEIFEAIFVNELEAWDIDEASWPKKLTFDLFNTWFNVELHSLVLDACVDEPLLEQDNDDDDDAYEDDEDEDEDDDDYDDDDDDFEDSGDDREFDEKDVA